MTNGLKKTLISISLLVLPAAIVWGYEIQFRSLRGNAERANETAFLEFERFAANLGQDSKGRAVDHTPAQGTGDSKNIVGKPVNAESSSAPKWDGKPEHFKEERNYQHDL